MPGFSLQSASARYVQVDENLCCGCVLCMKSCPTKAIRIRGGIARIEGVCINCVECVRVCPKGAIKTLSTETLDLKRAKNTVVSPSTVLYSQFGKEVLPNDVLLAMLYNFVEANMVVEQIKSYGMSVSDSIFDTVFWSGRFCEACKSWTRIPRMEVKLHICRDSRAKDGNIRQALIDRFGSPGTKKEPGLTYGLKKDLWQAFALAVTWWDKNT